MAESYKDPFYDQIDAQVTQQLGLPSGLLSNIRLKGEKSNASQVSEAGAKSVYQIIPATRDAVMKKYGVDAYKSPSDASMAAGYLLKESLDRNKGNVERAVREYHGGTNPKNWGKINEAYAGRVMGVKGGITQEKLDELIAKKQQAKPTQSAQRGMTQERLDELIAAKKPTKRGVIDKTIGVASDIGKGAAGIGEAALTLGTGAIAAPLAGLGAVAMDLQGMLPEGKTAAQVASESAEKYIYQPRTDTGKSTVQAIGEAAGVLQPLEAIAPMTGALAAVERGASFGAQATKAAASPVVAKATETAAKVAAPVKSAMARTLEKTSGIAAGAKGKTGGAIEAIADRIAPKAKVDLPPSVAESRKQAEMVGVGAAETAAENQRRALLASQGFDGDIAPTRGQLTQDPMVQAFESDVSKLPEGQQVAVRMARQNEAIDNKFNQIINATEKEAADLYDTGEMVVGTLGNIEKKAKAEVNAAYDAARAAGDLERPVPVNAIDDVLNESASAEGNVGVIGATRRELERLRTLEPERGGTGSIDDLTINQLEELRKFVGKNASTPADFAYAGEIKRAIDDVLDQAAASGEYKVARGIYKKYADTFKNRAIVADLLKNKRNSADRLVAMENVLNRTMLGGSTNDIAHLRTVLAKGGDDGVQAWRELKGALLEHIKDKATLTAKQGESASISPAQLSKQIKSLDKSRKLDTIFGKKDAQNLRDFAEAVNILRVPQTGTVNYSGTAAALQRQQAGIAADIAANFMLTGMPLPALTVAKAGVKRLRDAETYRRISESLKYSERF